MLIRVGCEIEFVFPEPTALILMLSLHPSRAPTVRKFEYLQVAPQVPIYHYFDMNGNYCGRTVVPAGTVKFHNDAIVEDCGLADLQAPGATQINVQDLPQDVLQFLLASRDDRRRCTVTIDRAAAIWRRDSSAPPPRTI